MEKRNKEGIEYLIQVYRNLVKDNTHETERRMEKMKELAETNEASKKTIESLKEFFNFSEVGFLIRNLEGVIEGNNLVIKRDKGFIVVHEEEDKLLKEKIESLLLESS